jgi:hypothetical protein
MTIDNEDIKPKKGGLCSTLRLPASMRSSYKDQRKASAGGIVLERQHHALAENGEMRMMSGER